ncbi:MAG TPA: PilW family protein [Gammaproteobacteria bacterium]|nr:PilW family protein [Gammaproteobacteria bacterium]HRA42176.1 PilW family protein [Gammaproteobacteria bacterium]
MTLGLVILVAAMQWYHVSKISHFAEKNKKEILDIGRTLFQFIRHDLQSSGYRGCRTQDSNFPIRRNFEKNGIPYKFLKTDRAVFGFEAAAGVCQQHIPQKICDSLRENSDVLVIYNIPQKVNFLKHSMVKSDDALFIQAGGRIQKNAMVLISDVQQGDFFIANDVENEKIFHQLGANSTFLLSKSYKQDAEVTELQTIAYYLGIPDRSSALRGTYSLFRSDIRQKSEEIVEGIVDFSVEYGFFESSDTSLEGTSEKFQYYAAAEVKPEQWALVRMVRLKIETKGETYHGISQKNHCWEYAFAIRNGHRVSSGIGVAISDIPYR